MIESTTTYRGYFLTTVRSGTPTETIQVCDRQGELIGFVHPERVYKVIDDWMNGDDGR